MPSEGPGAPSGGGPGTSSGSSASAFSSSGSPSDGAYSGVLPGDTSPSRGPGSCAGGSGGGGSGGRMWTRGGGAGGCGSSSGGNGPCRVAASTWNKMRMSSLRCFFSSRGRDAKGSIANRACTRGCFQRPLCAIPHEEFRTFKHKAANCSNDSGADARRRRMGPCIKPNANIRGPPWRMR